jgi:hypothetical protein
MDGLSATTYWIIFGNAAVWATWSVLTGEYAAGVPSLVNGPAADPSPAVPQPAVGSA